MSDNTSTAKKNPLRQMLMRIGGTFTVVMAGAGITPEEVAAANPGVITEEQLQKIMTGSDPTVPVATLSMIAELLGANLVIGLNIQAPLAQATPAPAPAAAPAATK